MATFVKGHRRAGKFVRGYRRNSQSLGMRKLARDPRYKNRPRITSTGRMQSALKHAYVMNKSHPTHASKKLLNKVVRAATKRGGSWTFNIGGSHTAIQLKDGKFRKFKFL